MVVLLLVFDWDRLGDSGAVEGRLMVLFESVLENVVVVVGATAPSSFLTLLPLPLFFPPFFTLPRLSLLASPTPPSSLLSSAKLSLDPDRDPNSGRSSLRVAQLFFSTRGDASGSSGDGGNDEVEVDVESAAEGSVADEGDSMSQSESLSEESAACADEDVDDVDATRPAGS